MNTFAARYRELPDETLAELAADGAGLLPEAREALLAELKTRGTDITLRQPHTEKHKMLRISSRWGKLPLRLLAVVAVVAVANVVPAVVNAVLGP